MEKPDSSSRSMLLSLLKVALVMRLDGLPSLLSHTFLQTQQIQTQVVFQRDVNAGTRHFGFRDTLTSSARGGDSIWTTRGMMGNTNIPLQLYLSLRM